MLDGDEYIENWDEYFLEMINGWEEVAEKSKKVSENK